MKRVPPGSGPLLVASLVALLAAGLVVSGHGNEVQQVVGAATAILAIFVGRTQGVQKTRSQQKEE